ncbi:MAG TPA: response regulator transcription factor [Tepidiformaceae bacterium]|nr:response regulator transcription factor [Tepidiformaceae bacterium]
MTRILLVDDEKRLVAALKRGLEGEGFAVDVALTGTDGQWMAEQNPYDTIVLDIMLPGRDGFAVCANLRESGIWTPVLMLTARDGRGDEVRSLDTGADDYLAKPFSFMVLLARIRSLVRRGARERPVVMRAGDLELDPAAHRCTRAGAAVELTSREFAVLEFLMRNAGVVVSKAQVLENVWDFAFEGDPNIVEVYIRRLRRKLDLPGRVPSIDTIRGEGYRLATGPG